MEETATTAEQGTDVYRAEREFIYTAVESRIHVEAKTYSQVRQVTISQKMSEGKEQQQPLFRR